MSDPTDPIPTEVPDPATASATSTAPASGAAPAPGSSDTGLAPKVAAGLACLFSLVGGIVFLVLEKKDKFVRVWAMQSVFLGGIVFAVSVAVAIASFILVHIPLLGWLLALVLFVAQWAFSLAWCVVYIITVIKAFSGQEWEIPWLGKLARQQLAQMDARQAPPAAS